MGFCSRLHGAFVGFSADKIVPKPVVGDAGATSSLGNMNLIDTEIKINLFNKLAVSMNLCKDISTA